AWNELLVPAALTYLILLHFLIVPDHASRNCHSYLMYWTVDAVNAAGVVEIESIAVYFKTAAVAAFVFAGCFFDPDLTAALAARFRCIDHVCPGLTIRRRAILFVHFFIELLPLALGAVWLLMKLEIASNDTISTTMDRLVPAFCLAFFISHISEVIRRRPE
ncbi:hypothetical protein PENTCL1PPCAC_24171, partial [Pristionchus entomophagus]